MKKGILLTLLLLLTGMTVVRAQAFFSTDKTAFFDELSAYLNTGTSKQERDEAAEMMRQRGFNVDILKAGDSFADSVAATQTDFGLWRLFALLALVVLLAETALLRLWRN